jgi:hypothetical protein
MTPESLASTLEGFLSSARDAVVLEDGAVAFDLAHSKYSISGEHNKCLLHVWSAERNIVRRILDLETRNDVLRLQVQRLGQSRPSKMEICRQRDRRTPTARRAARMAYQRTLQRVLERRFSGYKTVQLRTSMDLERSFGPVYARGLLQRGQSAFAVLGVNAHETQASIDAALTFGILWLDLCRQTYSGKALVEGLKLFVPAGCSTVLRERTALLEMAAAKWHLYELDEGQDELHQVDLSDRGNLSSRVVQAPDEASLHARFGEPIAYVHQLMPEMEVVVLSAGEIAFRRNGLEFARARLAHDPGSFRSEPEIVFGIGAEERVLSDKNVEDFVRLVRSIGEVRHAEGPRDHPLWRLRSERWLESLAAKNICAVDEQLDASCLYSQVPAFSAADRGMIDVLAATREGRLAVIEIKAEEDIHLPLQGLDYWSRVSWHHARGEFQRFGYFPRRELSAAPPLLFLVAPALRIHPATDTLLRYISSQIEWAVAAVDERWREGVRVVFRKRRSDLLRSAERLPLSA